MLLDEQLKKGTEAPTLKLLSLIVSQYCRTVSDICKLLDWMDTSLLLINEPNSEEDSRMEKSTFIDFHVQLQMILSNLRLAG